MQGVHSHIQFEFNVLLCNNCLHSSCHMFLKKFNSTHGIEQKKIKYVETTLCLNSIIPQFWHN